MTLTTSHKDAMELRRERVAHLRLRGLTVREIAYHLANPPEGMPRIVNPDTGDPYTHVTILSDLKALKAEWKANAQQDIADHMARQFAEIQIIKRDAYATRDPELALKALDREMKLLGTTAPQRFEVIDWESRVIEDIKAGRLAFDALAAAFDTSLAKKWFQAAGVPVVDVEVSE